MRKVVFMIAVTLLIGCSASQLTQEEKALKRAQLAQQVCDELSRRYYQIEVNFMHPFRMPSRHINYGYELRVHGDSVYSYLPYVGEARFAPYGGGKGLHFETVASSYKEERKGKDCTRIEMLVPNDEDTYLYVLEVSDNGKSYLSVFSQNRDAISFTGELRLKSENKK